MSVRNTHYLIVDDADGKTLAWFPKSEPRARERAQALARDTGHRLTEGFWTGNQFAHEGPEDLKRLLRF